MESSLTFDQKAMQRSFEEGDIVLLWDKRKEKSSMHKKNWYFVARSLSNGKEGHDKLILPY